APVGAESGSQASGPAHVLGSRKDWDRVARLLVGLLFLVMTAGGAALWVRMRQNPPAMYFNSSVPFAATDVALSPDGRVFAMVAYSDQANKNVIWTQAGGGRGGGTVPGTEEASHPFWPPGGGGAPPGRGGTWNRGGVILFSPEGFGGLYRVSSGGGTPMEVTKVDSSRSEFSHRWPVFLPDGRHFLYLAANFSGQFEKNKIFVGSLDSSERCPVVSRSSNAAYADPGHLLYLRDNALVAQRFDSSSYVLSGEPHTVSDEVRYFPIIDLAVFDAAGKGTLVAQTGKGAAKSQLTWFDRNGRPTSTVGTPGVFGNLCLSPDGRRVVVDQTDADGRHINIWIQDLGTRQRH